MRWELLEGVPEEEVRELLAIARRRRFARGEVVFHQDDPADTLHLVDKGRFAVRGIGQLGDAVMLTVLTPGDMFGELALVDGPDARRSATVSALEGGETLSIHRLDFERLRRLRPDTSQVVIAVLAEQVRRLSKLVAEAHYVSAEKRVRRRLLEVSGGYRTPERGELPDVEPRVVPLTQDDLADLAGTSRATVNRVLRAEQEKGAVKLGRGRTEVLDAPALARRSR
ncbi:MAG: Crp/Fnr family transcriptional regulator [Solirubrobacteraceae bacterium]|nr:Crp/Fnr family transcriptional regulator [Solirubrobacteraceae bacterium]